jgi:hypothetical protein
VLLLGLVARCRQYIGSPSYWYDEAFCLVNVHDRSFGELLGPLRSGAVNPPLFLWLERALYLLLGPSELAMRLPAVVAGIAALLVLIPLARRTVGSPAWLWVVALCAVSHHGVTHSYEARPYASDLLISVAILLAAVIILDPEAGRRARRWAWAGLLGAALLGPWFSFASAFVLAGVSLALLVGAWQGRRELWKPWLVLNLLLALSAFVLWYVSARHLYYTGLREHWGQRFPDLSHPGEALSWALGALHELGDYGTTGMGVPLLLLGGLGLAAFWRGRCPLAVLLVGPIAAGILAAVLRRYPFGDRLLFYAVPCLWLLAAQGLIVVVRWGRGRGAWLGVVLLAVLLVPGTVRAVKYVAVLMPKTEFREAYAHAWPRQRPGDVWLVAVPEMHELYCGKHHPYLAFDGLTPQVAQQARANRVWVIALSMDGIRQKRPEVARLLEGRQLAQSDCKDLLGVRVLLYGPQLSSGQGRTMEGDQAVPAPESANRSARALPDSQD